METLRTLTVGDTMLTVHLDYDDAAHDLSRQYGEGMTAREIPYDAYVYDRVEHLFAGPEVVVNGEYQRQWRDKRGRIVAINGLEDSPWREYRYLVSDGANYRGIAKRDIYRYCKQDLERLDALWRDQWSYVAIVATVTVDGREIGSAAIGGCEYESERQFMRDYADYLRDVTREALDDAKAFRAHLAKAS